jgi:putative FmdB family regulatory protein
MPIYEFYCEDCHTIYNFWSTRVNTEKVPSCPKCDREELERMVSRASIISGGGSEEEDPLGDLPIDETKLESAMASLASEAEGMDEDDPRAMAQFMRKFSDQVGLKYNDKMEEALSRLESGEDPDSLEDEMGDMFDDDEMPFDFKTIKAGLERRVQPVQRDETLYDL